MKRYICLLTFIAMLLSASIVYAADVTTASAHFFKHGITMFKITSIGDGETFTANGPIKGWWFTATDTSDSNPVSISQGISGSVNTFTFNVSSIGAGTGNFFIVK